MVYVARKSFKTKKTHVECENEAELRECHTLTKAVIVAAGESAGHEQNDTDIV